MSAEAGVALTHVGADGRARMVDVSGKAPTARVATATGLIVMSERAFALAMSNAAPKGAVAGVAELAGVMGAKRTADLIPLCHPLALSAVDVTVAPALDEVGLTVTATVRTNGPTGVEMEALTAVSVALLTIYDMLKAVDRTMTIGSIRVTEKAGGRSGHYRSDDA